MAIKHINSKGKIYYLQKGQTKSGKDRYFFSMKTDGHICNELPNKYEIYEHPNSQVFLRKIPKKIILDNEKDIVEKELKATSSLKNCKIDIRKNVITIYTPNQDIETIEKIFGKDFQLSAEKKRNIANIITYSPEMQFVLYDDKKRIFFTQRYNYRGRIDDWMDIGVLDSLDILAKKYIKHLGKDSFFELY